MQDIATSPRLAKSTPTHQSLVPLGGSPSTVQACFNGNAAAE
jgi:hypothetical protein